MKNEQALREHARAAVHTAAGTLPGEAEPERLLRQTQRTLQEQLAGVRRNHAPPACARGCAMCCHLRVMATPAEVFALLRYIRRRLHGPRLEALRENFARTAAQLHALPAARLLSTNIPCPLLADNACSMYPARPFNCRAYHSLDPGACQASFDKPEDSSLTHPQSSLLARLHEGVQQGFIDVLANGRLDSGQYELVTALDEALHDPGAEPRFLRGETAFHKALRC